MDTTELRFFNPYEDIRFTANRLPHWQQKGAVCFVTFRLSDAVPQHLREQWESDREAWLRFHPPPWNGKIEREYHERFSGAIERWLTQVKARVFYGGVPAQLLLQKHCATLMVTESRKSRGW